MGPLLFPRDVKAASYGFELPSFSGKTSQTLDGQNADGTCGNSHWKCLRLSITLSIKVWQKCVYACPLHEIMALDHLTSCKWEIFGAGKGI